MKNATVDGSICDDRSSDTPPALEKCTVSLKPASTSAWRDSAQKASRSFQ